MNAFAERQIACREQLENAKAEVEALFPHKEELTQKSARLEWSKIRNSSGTAGSFLKAIEEIGAKKLYYKLSDYDSVKGVSCK